MGEFRDIIRENLEEEKESPEQLKENWADTGKAVLFALQLIITVVSLLFQARALIRTAKAFRNLVPEVDDAISNAVGLKKKMQRVTIEPPTINSKPSQTPRRTVSQGEYRIVA